MGIGLLDPHHNTDIFFCLHQVITEPPVEHQVITEPPVEHKDLGKTPLFFN